jgi:transforming growth factor-beta-induced protein
MANNDDKSADTACDSGDYTELCELLKKVDLVDALSTGEWTVFLPSADALKNFYSEWDALTDDQIKDVILFHTVKGTAINSADLSCSDTIEMGNGDDSRTKCIGGNTYQTGIGNLGMDMIPQIIGQDIEACNGIIHILDGVMLPKISKAADDKTDNDDGTEYIMTEHGDYVDPGKVLI